MRTCLDVFQLCFEDQLSYHQIALALGIGSFTVTELAAGLAVSTSIGHSR